MKLVLLIDCGDTLCDESTEVRDVPGGVVKQASLFPGAEDTLREIHAMGISIILVADGLDASFQYILRNVRHLFSGWVVSETVGEEKPSEKMFREAFRQAGAAGTNTAFANESETRYVMVGNNLKKDIVGAKRLGIQTVLAAYSPRYRMEPETEEETPDLRIQDIRELPGVLRSIQEGLNPATGS